MSTSAAAPGLPEEARTFFAGSPAVLDIGEGVFACIHHVGGLERIELFFGVAPGGQSPLHRCVQGKAQCMVAVVAVLAGVDGRGRTCRRFHH